MSSILTVGTSEAKSTTSSIAGAAAVTAVCDNFARPVVAAARSGQLPSLPCAFTITAKDGGPIDSHTSPPSRCAASSTSNPPPPARTCRARRSAAYWRRPAGNRPSPHPQFYLNSSQRYPRHTNTRPPPPIPADRRAFRAPWQTRRPHQNSASQNQPRGAASSAPSGCQSRRTPATPAGKEPSPPGRHWPLALFSPGVPLHHPASIRRSSRLRRNLHAARMVHARVRAEKILTR